jgi:hypothetical protein
MPLNSTVGLWEKAEAAIKKYKGLISAGLLVWTLLVLFFLLPGRGMSPVWSVPYFSGAANFDISKGWRFLPDEVDSLKAAKGFSIYSYKFKKGPENHLQDYSLNVPGYLYWVFFAHRLFPFFNEIFSVVVLQILIHIGMSFVVLRYLTSALAKTGFLFLYSLNPLIIYIVLMPFYYFYQSIASFIALYFYLNRDKSAVRNSLLMILSVLVYFTRKTVILTDVFIVGIFLYQKRYFYAFLQAVLIVLIPFLLRYTGLDMQKNYGPWHTAFVGVGAYPNPYPELKELSDNSGIFLFRKEKNPSFTWEITGEYMKNLDLQVEYSEFTKSKYLDIVRKNPLLLIRNATLNFFQGYSLGHVSNKSVYINILISVSGLVFFLILLRRKAYFYMLAIGLSHLSFSPYFPPIPAYAFGTYLFLVFAVCTLILEKQAREGTAPLSSGG